MKTNRERRMRLMGVTGEDLVHSVRAVRGMQFDGSFGLRVCRRGLNRCYHSLDQNSSQRIDNFLPSAMFNQQRVWRCDTKMVLDVVL